MDKKDKSPKTLLGFPVVEVDSLEIEVKPDSFSLMPSGIDVKITASTNGIFVMSPKSEKDKELFSAFVELLRQESEHLIGYESEDDNE